MFRTAGKIRLQMTRSERTTSESGTSTHFGLVAFSITRHRPWAFRKIAVTYTP
jgi:hypothetical protein